MAAIGKAAQAAWNAAFNEADGLVVTATVGAASASRSSGHSVDWILSQVVDEDGTIRVVTA